jgi:hypothetical protein
MFPYGPPPSLVKFRDGTQSGGRSALFYEGVRAAAWSKVRGLLRRGYHPQVVGRVLQQSMLMSMRGSDAWWILGSSVYLISVGFPELGLRVVGFLHPTLLNMLGDYASNSLPLGHWKDLQS